MDNLCHTLVGAAFGEAGLKRQTRFGQATLLIASNLPDLDVLVFATGTPSVAFRRGWTHGIVGQALLPIALTLVMVAVARLRPPRSAAAGSGRPETGHLPGADVRRLLLLSYLGVIVHVLFDLLNNYGVRMLAPLDWHWFYGDTLFIIDPWLWLMLGAGVWMARHRGMTGPARSAIIAAALYVAVMVGSARAARSIVSDAWVTATGTAPRALMVGPMPVTPLTRAVIIDGGDRYASGTFGWFPADLQLDPATVLKNDRDPRVAIARQSPGVRAFLVWSRFPYWTFDATPEGTRVSVRDMRFGGLLGGRFAVSTVVPSQKR